MNSKPKLYNKIYLEKSGFHPWLLHLVPSPCTVTFINTGNLYLSPVFKNINTYIYVHVTPPIGSRLFSRSLSRGGFFLVPLNLDGWMKLYICVCVYTHAYSCVPIGTYVQTHMCMYIYVCTHTQYTCIVVCVPIGILV